MKSNIFVIGDIHGIGKELYEVVYSGKSIKNETILPVKGKDTIVLLGDLFDRGMHGHLVWKFIKEWNPLVIMGNHERKMLDFLKGRRKHVPYHYIWAIENLQKNGINTCELIKFLEDLPTIIHFDSFGNIIPKGTVNFPSGSDLIITHAGINPYNPLDSSLDCTVYLDKDKHGIPWWDRYDGDTLIVYGHLSEEDQSIRIKTNSNACINSVGIDTAAVSGGPISMFYWDNPVDKRWTPNIMQFKSGINWFEELKRTKYN